VNPSPRILLYSHDTFGLGHIRRNRKIAHSLATALPQSQIVIATGSTHAASFPDQPGVSMDILPEVRKKPDGTYESGTYGVPLSATIAGRRARLTEIARHFDPDILITDKEARGLMGELEPALDILKVRGARIVLGLREVLDAPDVLGREWARLGTLEAIERWYDEIWIYGAPEFHDPLDGVDAPPSVVGKRRFIGFLSSGSDPELMLPVAGLPKNYILITTGGGGDGNDLLNAVLGCAETVGGFPVPAVILPGPFLSEAKLSEIVRRTKPLRNAWLLGFNPESEAVMAGAKAVIGMCGYNTFCEVLEFDKPALFIPRETPRSEQLIRARIAAELGLAGFLSINDAANPEILCAAIQKLLNAPPPSASGHAPDFSGMKVLVERVKALLRKFDYKQEAVS
jgi:predicted glycosyltransferase